jgi:hypothetical protein
MDNQKVGNVSPKGLSPTIASAIADLPLLTNGNWKTGSTIATVGENPSAKGRLPYRFIHF